MKFLLTIISVFLISSGALLAQEINLMDANGKRHGVWKKSYPNTKQLRYQGQFDHGREIGVFNFYCEECGNQPYAIKEFKGNGEVLVTYFTKKGKLVSEGKMIGKTREGEWLTYHKNSKEVMIRENYRNDKLDGVVTTYYGNKVVTETTPYKNGIKEGLSKNYSYEGKLLNELTYQNDKLYGPAVYYNPTGEKTIEGQYKKGRKDGIWKYYKNGKVAVEEKFPKLLKKKD
ncbi:toxin-antitoxin system YwqK family antitoxin [Patiriisocius sp. Uisw_017]|jgi:antitoxin component YwqK of YwqJK toxin-antitoxin module|uniref:toxin-antitoxin system YwqK family antitoxin n=1 Tax=Patiriisocius sp. Uisw_017 TaxID=3230968 RepID=UPI0039E936C4